MMESVPLDHVMHVLPPSSRARLALVMQRGVTVTCTTTLADGQSKTVLSGQVDGRTVKTSGHAWIAPALVQELVALLEGSAA